MVVSPEAELGPHDPYSLLVILTMRTMIYAHLPSRDEVVDVQAALTRAFAMCPGVDLVEVEVRSEDDVTLGDLRQLTR